MHHRHRAFSKMSSDKHSRFVELCLQTLIHIWLWHANCISPGASWGLLLCEIQLRYRPTRAAPRPVMSNTDQASERHAFKSLPGTWEWIRNFLHSLNFIIIIIIIIIIISVWLCVILSFLCCNYPLWTLPVNNKAFLFELPGYTRGEKKKRDSHPPMCRIVVEGPHRQAATRLSKVYSFVR